MNKPTNKARGGNPKRELRIRPECRVTIGYDQLTEALLSAIQAAEAATDSTWGVLASIDQAFHDQEVVSRRLRAEHPKKG